MSKRVGPEAGEELSSCDILLSTTFDVESRDVTAAVFLAAVTDVTAVRGLFLSVTSNCSDRS